MTGKLFSLKHSFIPLLAAAILITAGIELLENHAPESPAAIAGRAGKALQQSEARISSGLIDLTNLPSDEAIRESIFNQQEDNLTTSFAYLKDSLFAWSDNDALISQAEADSLPSGSIVRLRNGWYEVFKASRGNYHFYTTLLIKHEFAYQNKFLVNSFNYELEIPGHYGFSLLPAAPVQHSFPVKSDAGRVVFYLTPGEAGNPSGNFSLSAWLFLLVALLLTAATYSFGRWLSVKSWILTILFSLLVVGLRMLMIHLRIPGELYATELFNPRLYASYVYMNSLGDFLLNVLLVLCLLMVFIHPGKRAARVNPKAGRALYFGLMAVTILATVLLDNLMRGIVFNSGINFNTSDVFDLNGYSFTGLLIVALLMLLPFLLVKTLAGLQEKGNAIIMLTGVGALTALCGYSLLSISSAALLLLLYATIYFLSSNRRGNGLTISAIITSLIITSVYCSVLIYTNSREKEQENRKLLAVKIETEQDRVAEHLFEDLQDKIARDTTLQNYFINPVNTTVLVSQRLHRRYFNSYWTKYEIGSYCFDAMNRPFNKVLDSASYDQFQSVIRLVGKPTYAENLFFLSNARGKSMYLARIPMKAPSPPEGGKKPSFGGDGETGTIFIELEPKLIQATQGFPELFISDKVAFNKELAHYSYAKYKNNELANQVGDFSYYFSSSVFDAGGTAIHPLANRQDSDYSFVNRDGYNHLLYRPNANNLIVVSKKQDTTYELITSFSYFFAFFSILLLLLLSIQNLMQGKLTASISLKKRIQVSVIAVVIFSVAMIGIGTVYYIIRKYDDNQSVRISSKLKSLLVTIENSQSERLKPDTIITEDFIFRMSRLSNNTSTDFNWYDIGGNLLFSSQPKIFDQGITSTLMNPVAYDMLTDKGKTQFVHPENIGKLNYIAAYQTLRNKQNQLLGYISLPFFEKESELNREISTFLSALINIYVLLLSLAVLVTFYIASRITNPLLLIQEKLSAINLGKRNEFIQWNQKDEIGALVKEYNKKVEELAISAELLARSERESAWQEMAKQVAHEIKNPLTPMKLGVQHLLNAYKDNSPGKEELVKKISQTLIQQIDTLSNIANEFSNFAQMPQARNEAVDLVSIVSGTIELFKESPGITINFDKKKTDVGTWKVFADKDQLIRLFSNLLKNAIQSIPSERQGKIDVSLSLNQGFFTVTIRDNGAGIADNQVEKIFTPNFTTKSGGMGLGLAMVKNIVENSGGKVRFETQIGAGTTFFVTLPAMPL